MGFFFFRNKSLRISSLKLLSPFYAQFWNVVPICCGACLLFFFDCSCFWPLRNLCQRKLIFKQQLSFVAFNDMRPTLPQSVEGVASIVPS